MPKALVQWMLLLSSKQFGLDASCCFKVEGDLPEVVPPAEDEVGLGIQRGAHLAKAAVTACTL